MFELLITKSVEPGILPSPLQYQRPPAPPAPPAGLAVVPAHAASAAAADPPVPDSHACAPAGFPAAPLPPCSPSVPLLPASPSAARPERIVTRRKAAAV